MVYIVRITVRLAAFAALTLIAHLPSIAAADTVVTGHYRFINGDTLTRSSYYARTKVRTSGPDGREFVFDQSADRVMVIDHATKTYWRGPIQMADSLATRILYQRRKELRPQIEANPAQYATIQSAVNDSSVVTKTEEMRKIAGYGCTRWDLGVGGYLKQERWVARAVNVPNFGPELEKVVLASTVDPLARVLIRQMLQMRTQDGFPLATHTTFQTLSTNGWFSFEATQVGSGPIPSSVWDAPRGYRRITL